MTTVPECTGACCAVFAIYALPHSEFNPARLSLMKDGDTLWRMLLPVGPDEAAERYAMHTDQRFPGGTSDCSYICRWWDADSRRCVNYDMRPAMCSLYPYTAGYTCVHCGVRLPEAEE